LPADKKERQLILEDLKTEKRTIILYEAPHHLIKTLQLLFDTLGDRRITICRELTKKFETVMPTTLAEALSYYEANEPRGEYVLVIEGKSREAVLADQRAVYEEMSMEEHMALYEEQGMDHREAMKAVAKDRGISKREVYNYLINVKK